LQNDGVSGDERSHLAETVRQIAPLDELEERHQLDTLAWIASGEELYRYEKPDMPPTHLVAYVALVDLDASALLLVDHRNCPAMVTGRWSRRA
jgi:hypothetical protein